MIHLALHGLAALVAVQDAAAPDAKLLDRAAWEQHAACVLSEREQRLVAHYLLATPEAQAEALRSLDGLRPRGASASWAPGLDAMRIVESRLSGGTGEFPDLDELAGALDLVPLPGVFETHHEGLGDALTIRVRRLYRFQPKADFTLSLRWRASDGSELPARTEPIGAGAVTDEGFDMYVRAPLSGPGPWRLYGVVTRPDAGEIGFAVPEVRVDAVHELRTRARAALAKEIEGQPGHRHLRVALDRLLRSGRRLSASLGAGELLAGIENWAENGPATGMPVPLELVHTDARGVEHWLWTYGPKEEPLRAVAILSPSAEAVDHVFAGDLGRTWIDFAERTRTQLFALHLPSLPQDVQTTITRLKSWVDGRALVLVARGDGGAKLPPIAEGAPLPYEGLVLCGPFAVRADAKSFGSLPRLCIGPGAAALAGQAHVKGLDGTGLVLIDDLSLARHTEEWLAARAAAGESK
ncbi:MAG: hypothetical protein NTV21_16115 [Planctomycetota bacterium]|nr:hypothetical protein [Planctomycetota bacterium]